MNENRCCQGHANTETPSQQQISQVVLCQTQIFCQNQLCIVLNCYVYDLYFYLFSKSNKTINKMA